jgi:hypothetical protein
MERDQRDMEKSAECVIACCCSDSRTGDYKDSQPLLIYFFLSTLPSRIIPRNARMTTATSVMWKIVLMTGAKNKKGSLVSQNGEPYFIWRLVPVERKELQEPFNRRRI